MKTHHVQVAGDGVQINEVESLSDFDALTVWLSRPRQAVALDTETTGLNIYGRDFAVRTVQLGDESSAFVIPVRPDFRFALVAALRRPERLVLHNAAYDLLALDRFGYIDAEAVWPRTFDTRTLSHLLDPRTKHEGGTGHGLKELSKVYLGDDAAEAEVALKARFRYLGHKLADGWAAIDVADPTYVRYAGLDPILTARLFSILGPMVRERGLGTLHDFERQVALVCGLMQKRGLRLDVPYAEKLVAELDVDEELARLDAKKMGVDNVNSPKQVGEVLKALGANLPETTSSGQPKVDKAVLAALSEADGPEAPVADAVLRCKQAGKWRESYVRACLDLRDDHDRVHPQINALQARTARMSISAPPLQQLPSGDHRIRRMFLPDGPGHKLISVDYSQVEMRVLAALSGDKAMTAAIMSGEDLHSSAARLMYGDAFTDKERKLAKIAGFAKVYGGGAAVIARQTGVDIQTAKHATDRYDRAFPGIKRYGRRLQDDAEHGRREVVTPSGRRLPLDRDRLYSATNYIVQSTARDVLAQALVNLHAEGLTDFLLLPIHDEVLASAPTFLAEEIAKDIAEVMETEFMGIPLTVDAEVIPGSWGSAYGADA